MLEGPRRPRKAPPASGEDRLLHWLRQRIDQPLLGDDAAVLPTRGPFAVTVDSQIEGVHFVAGTDPAQVAARLLAVNLSDLAAMGSRAEYAFLSLSAPSSFDHRRFFRGLLAACSRYGVRLAGGDLSRSPSEALIATLTLLGSKRRAARWLHRDGAAAGERLWLGGAVGESAAGRLLIAAGARWRGDGVQLPAGWKPGIHPRRILDAARRAVRRHLLPQPQMALGQWLAARTAAGAAIDVSDGLARDLHRLCAESAVGARIDANLLPLAAEFAPLCAALGEGDASDRENVRKPSGNGALTAATAGAKHQRLALGGGEDYVLLFTLPAGTAPPAHFGCTPIGTITARPQILLTTERSGRTATQPLPAAGWDHLDND